MLISQQEFPALQSAMQTPKKRLSIYQRNSTSPQSHSTQDTSQEVLEDDDQIFESLLQSFNHSIITTLVCEPLTYDPLRDVREIYGQFDPPKTYLNSEYPRVQFQDLIIHENKILQDNRKTIMIKNISKDITPQKLREELDINYKDKFDFIYMPFDLQTNQNQGYAFVNFLNSIIVLDFYRRYNGQSWSKTDNRVCILRYAKQQGKRDFINQLG